MTQVAAVDLLHPDTARLFGDEGVCGSRCTRAHTPGASDDLLLAAEPSLLRSAASGDAPCSSRTTRADTPGAAVSSSPSALTLDTDFAVRKSTQVGDRRIIEGVISTPDEDLEGERISEVGSKYDYFLHRAAINKAMLKRFDFSSFEGRHGFLAYEHAGDNSLKCRSCGADSCFRQSDTFIGWPLEIEKGYTFKGLDGYPRVGTRMVAEIFPASANHPFADSAWRLLNAIEKSAAPRRLGFSIEGAYIDDLPGARKSQPDLEKKVLVSGCVLTAKPVNQKTMAWVSVRKSLFGCTSDECCTKAVTAGAYATNPVGMEGGQALTGQSHQGVHSPLCKKRDCRDPRHKHLHDPEVRRSVITALVHRGYPHTVITQAVCRVLAAQHS